MGDVDLHSESYIMWVQILKVSISSQESVTDRITFGIQGINSMSILAHQEVQ
jgi:hypothetical protein